MVSLFCFCCDHSNPAGARFCNACGTPLHLKPCRHCEAINVRAAAHCHQCGETFAFVALEYARPDAEARREFAASDLNDAAEPELLRRSDWTRMPTLLAALLAVVSVSAYYVYRHPVAEADVTRRAEPAVAGAAPSAATVELSAPAESPEVPPIAQTPATSADDGPPQGTPAADAPDKVAPGSPGRGATPSSAGRGPSASGSFTATPARPVAPRPGKGSRVSRPRPAPAPLIATLPVDAAAVPFARHVADDSPVRPAMSRAPVVRPREPARRAAPNAPPPAEPPASVSCAEGTMLSSSCDVRTLPKGN